MATVRHRRLGDGAIEIHNMGESKAYVYIEGGVFSHLNVIELEPNEYSYFYNPSPFSFKLYSFDSMSEFEAYKKGINE